MCLEFVDGRWHLNKKYTVVTLAATVAGVVYLNNFFSAWATETFIHPEAVAMSDSICKARIEPVIQILRDTQRDGILTRKLVESLVTDSVKQAALKEMNDTTWKIKQ